MSHSKLNKELVEALCLSLSHSSAHAIDGATLAVLKHNGEKFSLGRTDAKRLELLSQVRSPDGEPVELDMDFRAFVQLDAVPNRVFSRFKKSILRKLAKSFKGVPLLRDHDESSLEARAGTITESKAVPVDGGTAFDMSAAVTAPFAVEALLAGNMDRFSIAVAFPGLDSLDCSACKQAALTGDCFHMPGDKLEDGSRVEYIHTEAEGVEVSGINVPAVVGTGLDSVRSALSLAARISLDKPKENAEDIRMAKKVSLALNLPEDADESTRVAAAGAFKARAEQAELSLTQERTLHTDISTENTKLKAQVAELGKADTARAIDALIVKYANRLPVVRDPEDVSKTITSNLEKQIRSLAANDINAAEAMIKSVPEVSAPAGVQSGNTDVVISAKPPEVGEYANEIEAVYKAQRAQLGLSEEDHAKFNSHTGTETKHLRTAN